MEKTRTEIHRYRTRDALLKTDSGSTADVVLAPAKPARNELDRLISVG